MSPIVAEFFRLYRRDGIDINPYGGWISCIQVVGDITLVTFTRAIFVPPSAQVQTGTDTYREVESHSGQVTATMLFSAASTPAALWSALDVCAPGLVKYLPEDNPSQRWKEFIAANTDHFDGQTGDFEAYEIGSLSSDEHAGVETLYHHGGEYACIWWHHGLPSLRWVLSGGKMWDEEGEVET